jgi:hypothetical protein
MKKSDYLEILKTIDNTTLQISVICENNIQYSVPYAIKSKEIGASAIQL